MDHFTTLHYTSIAIVALGAIGIYAYKAGKPKPLPGIPYNKASEHRFLGDGPDLFAWASKHGSPYGYLPELVTKLNSPIVQIFLRPFGRPWVLVADPYEAHDIRTRRFKEFDRSNFFGEVFKELLPKMHVHMPTGDEWKAHRKLIADTISPNFLGLVAGPQMWQSTQSIIALWRKRAELAQGRPFSASDDIFKGALDIVIAATFGAGCGSARAQLAALSAADSATLLPTRDDGEVEFPQTKDPPEFEAIQTLTHSLDIPIRSLFLRQAHWFALNFYPSLRSAQRHKARFLSQKLEEAYQKFAQRPEDIDTESFRHMTCALELLVGRETQMADKKKPSTQLQHANHPRRTLRLPPRRLRNHQHHNPMDPQTTHFSPTRTEKELRAALRTTYPRASEEGTSPTCEEITHSDVPYLDAVMEEVGRYALTALATIRFTLQDTEILGHAIPQGTDVFLLHNGPGMVVPALATKKNPKAASPDAATAREKMGAWKDDDIRVFDPERWLKKKKSRGGGDAEQQVFDANAGPSSPFGGWSETVSWEEMGAVGNEDGSDADCFSFRVVADAGEVVEYEGCGWRDA